MLFFRAPKRRVMALSLGGLALIGALLWWLFASPAITWSSDRMVGTVVFSPDGQLLASGSGDQRIRLWRLH